MAKIFFSGIAGSGMSALACFSVDKGHLVCGSDRLFDRKTDNKICETLIAKGIKIVPQDGSSLDRSFDFLIYSTAVEEDQIEIIKAKKLGIPCKTRPEYLCEISKEYETIAVAGTSGKSTVAGMIAFVMQRLGVEPNYLGGGRVKQFKTRQNIGNFLYGNSDFLVMEACESDGSIVNYQPSYSIILNLEFDHNYIEKTAKMFEALGKNTKKKVIINRDDENLSRCNFDKVKGFSVSANAEYKAEVIKYKPFETYFKLHGISFKVSLPGKYNLYNALSCITLLSETGFDLKDIAKVLPDFSGIDRRFDIILHKGNKLVIDDYAHNPHKIDNLMGCIKKISNRVCYIFQPHGFGPTRLMKQGYIEVFSRQLREKDYLILLPIYYAGGTTSKDISSEDLCHEIKAYGRNVEVISEKDLILDKLNKWDTYVILGARDEGLSDFAKSIAYRLR